MGERGVGSGGLAEFLFQQFRSAVEDARAKLIDEGWFGRRSNAPGGHDLGHEWAGPSIHDTPDKAPASSSFEEQWAPREPGPSPAEVPDLGIDW